QPRHVGRHAVVVMDAVAFRFAHRHLADVEAAPRGQERDETVLVAVQRELVHHFAPQGTDAAADVAEGLPGRDVNEPVEDPAPRSLERRRARPGGLPRGEIGRASWRESAWIAGGGGA